MCLMSKVIGPTPTRYYAHPVLKALVVLWGVVG